MTFARFSLALAVVCVAVGGLAYGYVVGIGLAGVWMVGFAAGQDYEGSQ